MRRKRDCVVLYESSEVEIDFIQPPLLLPKLFLKNLYLDGLSPPAANNIEDLEIEIGQRLFENMVKVVGENVKLKRKRKTTLAQAQAKHKAKKFKQNEKSLRSTMYGAPHVKPEEHVRKIEFHTNERALHRDYQPHIRHKHIVPKHESLLTSLFTGLTHHIPTMS